MKDYKIKVASDATHDGMNSLDKEREAFEATRKGEFHNVIFEINDFWKEGHYKGRTSHHDDLDDAHVLSNAWFSWLERAELAKSEQKKLEAEIESLKAQLAQYQSDDYVLVPKNPTDEICEAIARTANVCGGIANDIYEAMIEAQEQDNEQM